MYVIEVWAIQFRAESEKTRGLCSSGSSQEEGWLSLGSSAQVC